MLDRADAIEARRARHRVGQRHRAAARRRQRGIGGTEQRDHGRAERGGEMRHARVARHERVQLREERRQQRGTIAPGQRRRRRLGGEGRRRGRLGGRAEQDSARADGVEQPAELGDALGGPRLRRPVGGAQVHADRAASAVRAGLGEQRARFGPRGAVGRRRRERRLRVVGARATPLGEHQVLVDLVAPRLGQRDDVGEHLAAHAGVEADATARTPVPGGQRRLDRVGQQHGGVGREPPHDVGGSEPPGPRARIGHERVREPLAAEHRRPRPRQQHLRLRMRAAQRAHGRLGHHRVAQPVGQAHRERRDHGEGAGQARAKAARHCASPESSASRTAST